uniref:ARMC2 protein n=1 Tax=Buteo japonicus TaxID=224669 RepID=A0A8C0B2N1_9AVES
MQASKNKNTEKAEPFYRLSVPKQKTSSEIINEARNVLRTLRTRRPFTPTEDQRKLFGSGSSRAPQNRPPSVFRYCGFKIFFKYPLAGRDLIL